MLDNKEEFNIKLKVGYLYLHKEDFFNHEHVFLILEKSNDISSPFPMKSIEVFPKNYDTMAWNETIYSEDIIEIGYKKDYPEYFI